MLVKGAQVQVFGNLGPEPRESRQTLPTSQDAPHPTSQEAEVAPGREDRRQVRGDPAGQAVWNFLWVPGDGREDAEQLASLGSLEGLRGKVPG